MNNDQENVFCPVCNTITINNICKKCYAWKCVECTRFNTVARQICKSCQTISPHLEKNDF